MTALICDTSALLAYFDVAEPDHLRVVGTTALETGPLVVSPYVLAEIDYLVASRLGVKSELLILDEIGSGAWELPAFGAADVRAACDVIARYEDQKIGIADASIVVLAERYGTDRILTLDRRHFGAMRSSSGASFSVLPS